MDIKQIQEGSSVFFLTAARPRSRARKTIGMKWSGASCHFNFNLFFTRLLQIMEKRILEKLQDHYQNFVEENLLYANCEKYLVEFIFEEYFVIDFWVCLPNHCNFEGLNPVISFSSRKVFEFAFDGIFLFCSIW